MRVAVYSLTRERLAYTKVAFESLWDTALSLRHFVVENGSEDATAVWLQREYKPFRLIAHANNLGISKGANWALDAIFQEMPDVEVIVRFDNDCRVERPGLIENLASQVLRSGRFGRRSILGPLCKKRDLLEGIASEAVDGIRKTVYVHGRCRAVPADIYRAYRYPAGLPLAWGQDQHFCRWALHHGAFLGITEDVVYDLSVDQPRRFPAYEERKKLEQVTAPDGTRLAQNVCPNLVKYMQSL